MSETFFLNIEGRVCQQESPLRIQRDYFKLIMSGVGRRGTSDTELGRNSTPTNDRLEKPRAPWKAPRGTCRRGASDTELGRNSTPTSDRWEEPRAPWRAPSQGSAHRTGDRWQQSPEQSPGQLVRGSQYKAHGNQPVCTRFPHKRFG